MSSAIVDLKGLLPNIDVVSWGLWGKAPMMATTAASSGCRPRDGKGVVFIVNASTPEEAKNIWLAIALGVIAIILLGLMFLSFSRILPGWIAGAAPGAIGIASWVLTSRSESLRTRLRTTADR